LKGYRVALKSSSSGGENNNNKGRNSVALLSWQKDLNALTKYKETFSKTLTTDKNEKKLCGVSGRSYLRPTDSPF
jgi:hypothetical protein